MERMAFRAQTILADVLIAAAAFTLAYLVYPLRLYGLDLGDLTPLSVAKFVLLYAILAGGFTLLFRRELSPWRYASIPDALVLTPRAVTDVMIPAGEAGLLADLLTAELKQYVRRFGEPHRGFE